MRARTASALVLLTLAFRPAAAEPDDRAYLDLPITQTVNRDGVIRFAVWIKVGDRSVQAMIDTGSTGLRVLPNVVPGDFLGTPTDAAFSSGLHMQGLTTDMLIEVGSVRGSAPIEVIGHVGCGKDQPDCEGDQLSSDTFLIGGDGFPSQGYPAIIGLRLPSKENDLDNPFVAIGIKRWIVELPRPFDREPGHLILNPDESARDGFNALTRYGSADAWGCIQGGPLPDRKCGTVLFDTGAPRLDVSYEGLKKLERWDTSATGVLEFAGKDNAFSVPFQIGQNGGLVGASSSPPREGGLPEIRILAGVTPFFAYDILYDAAMQTVSLRPRKEPPRSGLADPIPISLAKRDQVENHHKTR